MSLYGINAYMSNSYYSSLFSNSGRMPNKSASSSTDLYALMQRVDKVRSRDYQKSMLNEYKKVFSSDETGSLESEEKLSKTAENLYKSASELATSNKIDFSNSESSVKSVQSFVDNYNSTIDALRKSDSVNALKKGLSMTNTAKAYARTLDRIGISVGSDNKLTLDKDKFSKAYDTTVKSLFNGTYSFAGKVADKASDISRAASLKAQVTYNSKGSLDYFTKLSLNSMFSESI